MAPGFVRRSGLNEPTIHEGMTKTTRHRPFGITLITIYDLIMVAILPTGVATYRFFTESAATRPDVLHMFVSVMIAAGVVIAAAAVWRAENWARITLLALVTIYYVSLALSAPFTVDLTAGAGSEELEYWLRASRSAFWIGLHGWYFFSAVGWFFDPTSSPPDNRAGWM